ncbi:MAG: hypothetical protein JW841_05195 [Deltaproteobacteria bacterium]|nr:hypothetical protein [Deltaproteobacteria bacterium]
MNHRFIFVLSAIFALSLTVSGCEQLLSTTFAISMVTGTPDLANDDDPLLAAIGADALPSATNVIVGVGERDSITSTNPPSPIANAVVSINYNNNRVPLAANNEKGSYEASSVNGANLTYELGVEYKTSINANDETYNLAVIAPQGIPKENVVFSPTMSQDPLLQVNIHPNNTDLTIDWSSASGATKKQVLISLLKFTFLGDTENPFDYDEPSNWQANSSKPIFQNVPQSTSEMLDFFSKTPPTYIVIPGSKLTTGTYILLVTMVDIDGNTSDNLSLGSCAIAGRATAFSFMVE